MIIWICLATIYAQQLWSILTCMFHRIGPAPVNKVGLRARPFVRPPKMTEKNERDLRIEGIVVEQTSRICLSHIYFLHWSLRDLSTLLHVDNLRKQFATIRNYRRSFYLECLFEFVYSVKWINERTVNERLITPEEAISLRHRTVQITAADLTSEKHVKVVVVNFGNDRSDIIQQWHFLPFYAPALFWSPADCRVKKLEQHSLIWITFTVLLKNWLRDKTYLVVFNEINLKTWLRLCKIW